MDFPKVEYSAAAKKNILEAPSLLWSDPQHTMVSGKVKRILCRALALRCGLQSRRGSSSIPMAWELLGMRVMGHRPNPARPQALRFNKPQVIPSIAAEMEGCHYTAHY